jgi:tetratricopeptide (TPR) repeat protein
MSQLILCLVTVIFLILIGLGMGADLPLEKTSALSCDLAGVQLVSSPGNDDTIKVSLVTNDSITNSSNDNNSESQRILSGLVALNQTSMANTTTLSSKRFETNQQPEYSVPVVTSSSDDWFKEGNMNYDKGDYAKAIACYDQAIQLNPKFSGSWCNKGIALCRLEKYQEAIEAFDKALEIDPNYAKALKSRDAALQAIGRGNENVQEEHF